jgi:hypothetical protein
MEVPDRWHRALDLTGDRYADSPRQSRDDVVERVDDPFVPMLLEPTRD